MKIAKYLANVCRIISSTSKFISSVFSHVLLKINILKSFMQFYRNLIRLRENLFICTRLYYPIFSITLPSHFHIVEVDKCEVLFNQLQQCLWWWSLYVECQQLKEHSNVRSSEDEAKPDEQHEKDSRKIRHRLFSLANAEEDADDVIAWHSHILAIDNVLDPSRLPVDNHCHRKCCTKRKAEQHPSRLVEWHRELLIRRVRFRWRNDDSIDLFSVS
jgi:hypothetical protein